MLIGTITKTQPLVDFLLSLGANDMQIIRDTTTRRRIISAPAADMTGRICDDVKKLNEKVMISWFEPTKGEKSYLAHHDYSKFRFPNKYFSIDELAANAIVTKHNLLDFLIKESACGFLRFYDDQSKEWYFQATGTKLIGKCAVDIDLDLKVYISSIKLSDGTYYYLAHN